MRKQILLAIAFALCLSGDAFAQQATFIVQDERFEPCKVFKMKVLIPADNANRDVSRRRPDNSLDPKMVFNPCPSDTGNFVVKKIEPQPKNGNNYVRLDLESLERRVKSQLKSAQPAQPEKSPQKRPDQK